MPLTHTHRESKKRRACFVTSDSQMPCDAQMAFTKCLEICYDILEFKGRLLP